MWFSVVRSNLFVFVSYEIWRLLSSYFVCFHRKIRNIEIFKVVAFVWICQYVKIWRIFSIHAIFYVLYKWTCKKLHYSRKYRLYVVVDKYILSFHLRRRGGNLSFMWVKRKLPGVELLFYIFPDITRRKKFCLNTEIHM